MTISLFAIRDCLEKEDLLKEFNNSLEVLKYDLAMRKAIEVLKENN